MRPLHSTRILPVLAACAALGLAALPARAQLQVPDDVQGGFLTPGSGLGGDFEDLTGEGDIGDAGEPSESEILVEGIAAQVGGGVVLVSEVRRLAAPIESRMRKAGVAEYEIVQMRKEALEQLIERRLIEDLVRRAQLEATDAEVTAAIDSIAAENGLSVDQMRQTIASHGLTVDEYRAKIKSEIERNKVLGSMVRTRVRIEETEIQELYDQRFGEQRDSGAEVHLRHILIAVRPDLMRDQGTACVMARQVRQEIVTGEISFERAAGRLSDVAAERGGDMGWVHLDELAGWMTPVVGGLEPGQVSDVIEMPFGCNLLQVVERREFRPVTYDQARPALEQHIFSQKMETEYLKWIEELRGQVYIERKGVYADASATPTRAR